MYALCVSGAVNTQGFVWKFFINLYINFHSFIHSTPWDAADAYGTQSSRDCSKQFPFTFLKDEI